MRTLFTLIVATCLVGAAVGQSPSEAPKPGPEHQQLQSWFGEWTYEGVDYQTPLGPAGRFTGRMTGHPILNGFGAECRWEQKGPLGEVRSIEIDGYDPVAKNHTYSWNGSSGAVGRGTFTISGNKSAWEGTGVASGKPFRTRGTETFAQDGMSYYKKEEISTDGKTWIPACELRLTKVRAVAAESAGVEPELTNISAEAKTPVPASKQPATPLQELGDHLVGRWASDVTWAVDYPGLGKKGEKVTGFDVWRRTADGTALECDWLLGATCGRTLLWWDASSQQIRTLDVNSGGNWAQGTITKQGTRWAWATAGRFADGRRVEYQSETTFSDDGRGRVDAGATILEGVRNEFRDVFKRVAN